MDDEPDDDDPRGPDRPSYPLHLGLFAATCVTTTWFGGVAFSATLMAILTCHEFGHYLMARRHGVAVSLPYFIPLPPQVSLGTLGAVIKMRRPIANPDALFDVGVAGPIAGLVVALPLLVIGLTLSSVGPVPADSVLEGNSLLYLGLKAALFGRYLPGDGVDVQLHPMAFAAWVGLLVTMINLIPIGQLDGGHLARAYLGARHERLSRRLHVALPVLGAVCGATLVGLARVAGQGWLDALRYGLWGLSPYLVWALLLAGMRGMSDGYHPPILDRPLSPGRRRLAQVMLVVFLLIFMPVPMRPALPWP